VFDDNDLPGSDDDGGGWFDWIDVGSGPTSWIVACVLLGLLAFLYFAY